jgi:heme A synthase
MGWYMVKSGLIDRPSVSHFRLAAHLGLALLIFSMDVVDGARFHATQAYRAGQISRKA